MEHFVAVVGLSLIFCSASAAPQCGLFCNRLFQPQASGSSSSANAQSYGNSLNLGNLFGISNSYSSANAQAQGAGIASGAQSSALTNNINVAGLPISNSISGSKASSTAGAQSGSLNHGLNVGGFGIQTSVAGANANSHSGYGNPYGQQQYAQLVQQGMQQGAQFVGQIASNILGQRPGGYYPTQGNQGSYNRPNQPAQYPNQGQNQIQNQGQNQGGQGNYNRPNQPGQYPNQGQNQGGQGNYNRPNQPGQYQNQGQMNGGIPPSQNSNNLGQQNQNQIQGNIPTVTSPNKNPSGEYLTPSNNNIATTNPSQGQTSIGNQHNQNLQPLPPSTNVSPPNNLQPSDGELDSLLSILDQESNKGKENVPVTPTVNPEGLDYDFDVRVDDGKDERERRDVNDQKMVFGEKTNENDKKVEGVAEEEGGINNRFLGSFGRKPLNHGANALRQSVGLVKGAFQGGFHFPTEDHGYVPSYQRPPGPEHQNQHGAGPVQQGPGPVQQRPGPVQQGPGPVQQGPGQGPVPNQQLGGGASNAQGQAHNTGAGFNQNAGANTHSSNVQNELGTFQNTGGSSISANLANDGSSGQLSAANTQQSSSQTANGYKEQNSAQSQSANFDNQGNLQASNAGTNVNVVREKDKERVETMGSASSVNKNQHGISNSGANANTVQFNENGVMGQQNSAQGQSTHIGNDGSVSGSTSNAGTQQWTGPGGITGQSSSAQSSSSSQGGHGSGGSGSGASAGTSSFGGVAGANAGTFGGSQLGGSNAGASAGSGGFGGGAGASATSSASSNTGHFGHPNGQQFSQAGSQSFAMSGSIPHGVDLNRVPINFGFFGR